MDSFNNKINDIINHFSFCFMLFIVLPVTAYYFNADILLWEGGRWFLRCAIVFFVLLPLVLLCGKYFPKFWKLIDFFSILIVLYLLVRNFFDPIPFGFLDGRAVEHVLIITDSTLWYSFILLCALGVAIFFKRETMNFLANMGTLVSFLFVCFVLVTISQTQGKDIVHLSKKEVEHNNFNRFSSTKNIVVISFDGIQGDFFYDALKENPTLQSVFDGFTFYTNVTSYAPLTRYSLYSTVFGQNSPMEKSAELMSTDFSSRKDSLIYNVAKGGYAVDTFVPPPIRLWHDYLNQSIIQNVPAFSAGEIALFRVLPKSLSWQVVVLYDRITHWYYAVTTKSVRDLIQSDRRNGGAMDIFAFRKLHHDAFLVKEPVFKFHHYMFTHAPMRFNERCQYDPDTPQNYTSAQKEIICAIHEFNQFIVTLKERGIYDNALIILTSDHGMEHFLQPDEKNGQLYLGGLLGYEGRWVAGRYWPALLLKMPGEKGDLHFNDQPVSLVDIAPTVYQAISNNYCEHARCDGQSLQSLQNIKSPRKRKIGLYHDVIEWEQVEKAVEDNRLSDTYDITGSAYLGVVNRFIDLGLSERTFVCHKDIIVNDDFRGLRLGLTAGKEDAWSRGKRVLFIFSLDTVECAKHNIQVVLASYHSQKITVLLNDVAIGEIVLNTSDVKNFMLSYSPELMKQGENRLQFIIQHAKNDEGNKSGVQFVSIRFE